MRTFFQPHNALWWVYCAGVGLGMIALSVVVAPALSATAAPVASALPFIAVTAVLFTLVLRLLDPFRLRPTWLLVAGATAGGTIAAAVSLQGNRYIYAVASQVLGTEMGTAWESALAGPLTEEWSKGLCILLVMLIGTTTARRPLHGLLIGAYTGLGFQIVENILYAANGALEDVNSDFSGVWTTSIIRALTGVSSHWIWSALVGVGITLLLARRVAPGVGLFVLAWALHFTWNAPIGAGLVGMGLKGALSLACLVAVVRWVWRQEREHRAQHDPDYRAASSGSGMEQKLS